MINNKTRIISFLMAFVLIFTFAFVNPLTVSKSYAVLPAIALTTNGVKIIMGALASAGIGFTAGQALQEVDYEQAVESIAGVVYRTLDGAEKLALMALSVVDNIVEVPISLYNAIVNNAKKVFETAEYSQSLADQGISIKYASLSSDNVDDPDLQLPIYQLTNVLASSSQKTRVVDMREAEPFLVYDGTKSDSDSFPLAECVTKNYFDFSSETNPLLVSSDSAYLILTPSIRGYNIKLSTTKYANNICFRRVSSTSKSLLFSDYSDGSFDNSAGGLDFPTLSSSDLMSSIVIYWYLIRNSDGVIGVHYDVYKDGEFYKQRQFINSSNTYGLNSVITSDNLYDTPSGLDTTINVESSPAPVITNTDASANVLTLPTTVEGSIGLTSTDVNVGVTDVPGTGEGTGIGEATGLLQKILDTLMALGDYILEGIKNIFMPDLDGIILLKEAIEEKFSIIGELKEMIDDILDILTNNEPEPPNIIIPLSKAEGNIDYGQDCIALDLSWYGRYKEVVDLFIIGFAYVFFIWRLYQRLPGIISGSDGINWSALSGKSEYSGSGNIGFKPGGGKK